MAGIVSDEEWTNYKATHGKVYEGEDDMKRKEQYTKNKKTVEEHNKKYDAGQVTYSMGINQFSDYFDHESPCGCMKPKETKCCK